MSIAIADETHFLMVKQGIILMDDPPDLNNSGCSIDIEHLTVSDLCFQMFECFKFTFSSNWWCACRINLKFDVILLEGLILEGSVRSDDCKRLKYKIEPSIRGRMCEII